MIPQAFDYHAPKTLAEAVGLLARFGDDAKALSGGQSLIPLMKLRFAGPAHLVDINGIPGLDYLQEEGSTLKIGALVRQAQLEQSPVVKAKFPLLADAVRMIADPQVRNRGTLAGNLAHGDPANDQPAVMLALGAQVVIAGSKGERTLPIDKFFIGTLTTALNAGELVKEILVPIPPANSGGAYYKIERRVGDFAIVAVGSQVTLDKSGNCQKVGIGLTNAGPTPIKATKAEAFLTGKAPSEANLTEAGRLAAEMSDPASDTRAPADYKKAMVQELTIRTLRTAVARAKGGAA
ncbi:MAG: xanthine dehydrogenase family protein subunit M [Candidatus Lambdaproteobacteria bacterium]|nr:xanthine dehydrogenase family protein subunit M [Candidatus Lambdaproteobacteria bacterium]